MIVRMLAVVQLVAFVVIGAAIVEPDRDRVLSGHWLETIYPWWAAALVTAGAVCACAVLLLGRSLPVVVAGATAVTAVSSAQLAGLGVVAFKHLEPAFGMGGVYAGSLDALRRLAVVIGIAGVLGALSAVASLIAQRQFRSSVSSTARAMHLVAGVLVILLLPVTISQGDSDMLDATSLGAVALIYSLPWGVAILAGGWSSRAVGLTALVACALSAAISALARSMAYLIHPDPTVVFAVVGLAMAALAVARLAQSEATTGGPRLS